ncbi:bifunctional biotin--[acetyl-CoA-carboxylase] synthetase/biotin operon repressor [Barrientosiimonas marina]|uniref:Bifunctional ligase/repressor BirA n=1 Tax=Lentibacillus kimchii TaxID=1542911 RepID=A0ABW2UWE4_9BACI
MVKMQSTRYHLIELLTTTEGTYISGQLLSDRLHISRSAIWKHMKELEKDGYVIEGIPRKGYRIVQSPDKVSPNTIQWGLETEWLGQKIIHKTSTESTQEIAQQAARNNAEHGTVVIADEQTNGRGRMGRAWKSAKNKGVWMSLILRPAITPAAATRLTLLTATVLADVITKQTAAAPAIKWPNDLLINHKKIAGILTEMQAEQDRTQYVIVGIGVNVNQTLYDFAAPLKQQAASIKSETGEDQPIVPLIQSLLRSFEKTYDAFIDIGFSGIKTKWETYAYRIGERIRVQTNQTVFEAVLAGIADDGALLVQTDAGETQNVYSGEISWLT